MLWGLSESPYVKHLEQCDWNNTHTLSVSALKISMQSEDSLPQISLVSVGEGDVGRQGETRHECRNSMSSATHGLFICVSPGPRSTCSPPPSSASHRKPLPAALPSRFPGHPALLFYKYCQKWAVTIVYAASPTQLWTHWKRKESTCPKIQLIQCLCTALSRECEGHVWVDPNCLGIKSGGPVPLLQISCFPGIWPGQVA